MTHQLGSLADITTGKLDANAATEDGKYPFFTCSNTPSRINKYEFDCPAILVAGNGNVGNVTYYSGKFNAYQRTYVLTDFSDSVNPIFLSYYLKCYLTIYAETKAQGSIMPYITLPTLQDCPVPSLPKDQQESIAKTLSSIDKQTSNSHIANQLLNRVVNFVYDYWFVQFDFPDGNGRPYKSNGGKMVYNDQLKQEIPEGWEVKGLMTIADWTSGAQPPKSQHIDHPSNGYVRFIQNRDYSDDKNVRYIPESKANKLCNEYDIMVDKYGDAGRTRFGLKGAFNVALAKITPTMPNTQEYLRCYLSQQSVYRHLHESCMMSTRASLNAASLAQLSIVVPPQAILQKFENLSKKCIELALVSKEQSKQLTSLRDWLLPMLMSGQAKVNKQDQQTTLTT